LTFSIALQAAQHGLHDGDDDGHKYFDIDDEPPTAAQLVVNVNPC